MVPEGKTKSPLSCVDTDAACAGAGAVAVTLGMPAYSAGTGTGPDGVNPGLPGGL